MKSMGMLAWSCSRFFVIVESFFGLVCQVIVLFLFGFVIYILIAVFDNCFCLCHFYLFLSLA